MVVEKTESPARSRIELVIIHLIRNSILDEPIASKCVDQVLFPQSQYYIILSDGIRKINLGICMGKYVV